MKQKQGQTVSAAWPLASYALGILEWHAIGGSLAVRTTMALVPVAVFVAAEFGLERRQRIAVLSVAGGLFAAMVVGHISLSAATPSGVAALSYAVVSLIAAAVRRRRRARSRQARQARP